MLVGFLLIAFALLYAALLRKGYDWRAAAAVLWGMGMAAALTWEILSGCHGLTVIALVLVWLSLIAVAARYLYRCTRGPRPLALSPGAVGILYNERRTARSWESPAVVLGLVAAFALFLAACGTRSVGDECSVSFKGWHARESSGSVWWRWSPGTGEVHILASRDRDVSMEGSVGSIEQPNAVDVVFNGARKVRLEMTSPTPVVLHGISLHLLAGDNVVQFVSERPGVRIPGDSRVLAIDVRDLQIQAPNGLACVVR